jgi:type IV pilus assembly protein PilX
MSAASRPCLHDPRARQRGNTLLVVLVLLLVMTLLALASLRIGNLEERMTANLFDRGLAFQATEAALREGEALARSSSTPPAAGSDCANGLCGKPQSVLSEQQITALFKKNARTASPLEKNTLAVPKSDNVRYLVVHRGRAEAIHGCSSVLGASGGIKDPLCLVEAYQVEARYEATDRAAVTLRSVVHVPAPSSTSP